MFRITVLNLFIPLALLLNSCGWAEWPPTEDKPRASNRPEYLSKTNIVFSSVSSVIVKKGDTVYGLSRQYGISARSIIEKNKLKAPYVLRPGNQLILPKARKYEVKKGDTVTSIAGQLKINAYSIVRLNNLHPPYTIYPKQLLSIPNSFMTSSISRSKYNSLLSGKKSTKVVKKRKNRISDAPPEISGDGFLWPVKGRVLSSYGGKSEGLQNDGINIAAPRGAAVLAAENGIVAYSGNELRGFGNLLLLKHSDGWITAYAHNEVLLVKRGDKIKKGQTIAKVGSSGSVKKPQLHFELRKGKKAINPIKHLPKLYKG